MANTQTSTAAKLLPILSIFTILIVGLAFCAGLSGAFLGSRLAERGSVLNPSQDQVNVSVTNEDSAIIKVAQDASPAVVSIIISKDLPIYENYYPYGNDFFPSRRQVGTEQQQVGAGTGFVITKEGLILTNRHVVSDTKANYTVILNDGTKLDAEVLARDSILDIAIVKVKPASDLPTLEFSDSSAIKVGQTVIAIGNSLGQFSNTVSAGIISGLARSIIAGDSSGGGSEQLQGVIQTDASINPGNSGGPLLDITGKVIGVNVAVAQDAENIGFAIPINLIAPVVESVSQFGEIRRPFLGVRYQTVDAALATEEKLPVDYGALVVSSTDEPAIVPDSPAATAGLKEGDLIVEIKGVKLDKNTSLQTEIQKYKVGDEVTVKFWRDGKEQTVTAKLQQLQD